MNAQKEKQTDTGEKKKRPSVFFQIYSGAILILLTGFVMFAVLIGIMYFF